MNLKYKNKQNANINYNQFEFMQNLQQNFHSNIQIIINLNEK